MTTEERLEKLEQELKETKAGLAAAKRRNRWMLRGGSDENENKSKDCSISAPTLRLL